MRRSAFLKIMAGTAAGLSLSGFKLIEKKKKKAVYFIFGGGVSSEHISKLGELLSLQLKLKSYFKGTPTLYIQNNVSDSHADCAECLILNWKEKYPNDLMVYTPNTILSRKLSALQVKTPLKNEISISDRQVCESFNSALENPECYNLILHLQDADVLHYNVNHGNEIITANTEQILTFCQKALQKGFSEICLSNDFGRCITNESAQHHTLECIKDFIEYKFSV